MAIALGVAWVLIMGPPPLPDKADVVVSMLGQGLGIGISIWAMLRFGPRTSEKPIKAMMPMSA